MGIVSDFNILQYEPISTTYAAPQAKAARRSSDPARVVTAVVKIAKEMYIATMDSLSIRDLLLLNLRTFRAAIPTPTPMSTPSRI